MKTAANIEAQDASANQSAAQTGYKPISGGRRRDIALSLHDCVYKESVKLKNTPAVSMNAV